jgi:hypothetical protein
MIFMPFYGAKDISHWDPDLFKIAEDRDAFMMSVMSCYESRAAMVTKFLKQHGQEARDLGAACMPPRCRRAASSTPTW